MAAQKSRRRPAAKGQSPARIARNDLAVRIDRAVRIALIAGALSLLPGLARAEHAGQRYLGAGGPFLGGAARDLDGHGTGQLFVGGSGYAYLADGRLRLGGGGQASLLSSAGDGREGALRWGGLELGYDFWGRGRLELPLSLALGGGRYALERHARIAGQAHRSLVERQSEGIGTLRVAAGAEFRLGGALKLALSLGYQLGFSDRVVLHGADLSLQVAFLIPRSGAR